MKNPFYYGEAVAGEYFANRKQEIKSLCSDLERGQNVIIFSPRRYGKTSLIKRVLSILGERGVLIFYVDLYAVTSKKKFIEIYARSIAQQIEPDLNKVAILLKNLLPRIIPKLVIKSEGLPQFEFEFKGTVKNISEILEDIYEAVPNYIGKKKKKAVVVFDEFQEILKLEDDEIERTLRSHIQFHHDVAYVFMGSKKHLIFQLFNDENRPLYKSGRLFPLYKIKPEDFSPFIARKFEENKIHIAASLISEILKITECHPYYAQLFCSVLWDRCIENGKVETGDLGPAISEAISRAAAGYIEIFDSLSNQQKRFLDALLREEDGANLYSREFILKNELGTPSTVQRAIKTLMLKGIIEKEDGNCIFSDIFFKKWLFAKENTF